MHGHADKLAAVLEKLRETADWQRRWLVFIGDLVDRGPDSKMVVDMVTDLLIEHPRTTVVAGNHEFAMSASLGLIPTPQYSDWSAQWVKYYEAEPTFESYSANFANLIELAERMPAGIVYHVEWHFENFGNTNRAVRCFCLHFGRARQWMAFGSRNALFKDFLL